MIKALDKWLVPWLRHAWHSSPQPVTDVMIAVCDHFEPFHHTDKAGALRRLEIWKDKLPGLVNAGRDHDGTGPKHTFFYPVEQYDQDVLASLAGLCLQTQNEVEVHLHHDKDTAENFVATLKQGINDLRHHGLLGSNAGGTPCFGFIHGNWALDHSDPAGHGCGVTGELELLKKAGCYADLTMPSAPHPTQTPIVNQLYYAQNKPGGCAHHQGIRVTAGDRGTGKLRHLQDHLLLVQGPLKLNFIHRKWGVLPRVENSDLGPQNPPTAARMKQWLDCRISVAGAENWIFIKLHTHGAAEFGHRSNLGDERRQFHADIEKMAQQCGFKLHYVSAREMVNILHAAEDGKKGDAGVWRDYLYSKPPLLQTV